MPLVFDYKKGCTVKDCKETKDLVEIYNAGILIRPEYLCPHHLEVFKFEIANDYASHTAGYITVMGIKA